VTAVATAARRPAPRVAPLRAVRRVPAAGWVIALLTLLNAVAWSIIVPPFHVPDETAHAYYVQYLAETGKLPEARADQAWYSEDELRVLEAQRFYEVVGESRNRMPAGADAERELDAAQAPGLDRVGVGSAATATSNPPLYYAPVAVAYAVMSGADVTGRLAAMRLVSALMAALTAVCVFLFLRELLPGSPLAWTVGGLAAGLQPMFAFISSGVNNDAGLYLASAALFLAVARVLRRGLTPGRAVAAGLLLALGVLVKTQVIALAPGVALALVLAAWRGRGLMSPWRSLAAGAGAALAPIALYGLLGATVWDRPVVDRVGEVTSGAAPGVTRPWLLGEQISYLWQLYLPRAPNLVDLIPAVPAYDMWFKGLVGRFGWLDYGFPDWVYPAAGGIWVIVGALAVTRLWERREVVRRRGAELLVFAAMAAGLATAIAVAAYQSRVNLGGESFIQARYLLPLLPLYAVFPALAVGALGRRRAPVVAVVLVAGVLAHSLFAQMQTLMRFYG
jgi:4-amino-4-deoxy-L-arabinose transferase-like glycosyltransferase